MRSCLQWQVIPPPERSSKGFCVSGSGRRLTQHTGLHGPHPRNTGTSTPKSHAVQPFSEGLQMFAGQRVRQASKRMESLPHGCSGLRPGEVVMSITPWGWYGLAVTGRTSRGRPSVRHTHPPWWGLAGLCSTGVVAPAVDWAEFALWWLGWRRCWRLDARKIGNHFVERIDWLGLFPGLGLCQHTAAYKQQRCK